MRYFLDAEFDGHCGPLLSIAMVREDGYGLHVRTTTEPSDPWVIANVMPMMEREIADLSVIVPPDFVGHSLRFLLQDELEPVIVSDSPQDVRYFCAAITTGDDGGYSPFPFKGLTFEIHGVDPYPTDLPGAVQHNAYWDAMALRHTLMGAAR